jgi:NAD(P)-dependent dehydrogenase (short-subunit alcohol dehydrogenase family)
MNSIASGTVLITGPTGGLGKAATLAIAKRPAPQRPDLLLVGRAGKALSDVAAAARAAGATVQEIGCDLARLADVRNAGQQVRHLLDAGAVRPLHGLVANAGVSVVDTHNASADGYELTFAVNYLAHAQLIGDLLDSLVEPARVALLGSNTYHQNIFAAFCESRQRSGATQSNLLSPPPPTCRRHSSSAGPPTPTPNSRCFTTRTNCNVEHQPGSTRRCTSRDSCRAPA